MKLGMGQNLTLASPSLSEVTRSGGKMTGSTFDNVKPCPPPPRPSKRPIRKKNNNNNNRRRAAHKLNSVDNSKRTKLPGATKRHAQTASGVNFEDLPYEVHRLIFDCFEYVEDAVCLGLSNRYFWQFGREALYDYYALFLAPWAGEDIMCLGGSVKCGDLPPHHVSAEEKRKYRHSLVTYPNLDKDLKMNADSASALFTVHYLAHHDGAQRKTLDLINEFLSAYERCRSIGWDLALKKTSSSTITVDSGFYSVQETRVLRHLTTRALIRADTIALEPEFMRGPFLNGIGFGLVLLSCINWSSSASTDPMSFGEILKRVWARHRLDITTAKKKVDKDIMLDIATVWEETEGPRWRAIVKKRARKQRAIVNKRARKQQPRRRSPRYPKRR